VTDVARLLLGIDPLEWTRTFEPRSWRLSGLLYDGGVFGSAMRRGPSVRVEEVAAWLAVPGSSAATTVEVRAGVVVLGTVAVPWTSASLTPVRVPLAGTWASGEVLSVRLTAVAPGARGLTVQVFGGT
jgi:hypothetical protein